MNVEKQQYPETLSYETEEQIEKRLFYVNEIRKATPVKKRDMRLKFGELTIELLLLQMKLRIVCGKEGKIKKRRLQEAGKDSEKERRLLLHELARQTSDNKEIARFMRHYRSYH